MTQEVEMSWVELVDDDELTEEEVAELEAAEAEPAVELEGGDDGEGGEGGIPDFSAGEDEGRPEITRVEAAPISTQRVLAERETVRRQVDGAAQEGPPSEREIRAALASEAEAAERMREEVLAQRQRDQDARDREIRQRRKAEREKERLAQEAMAARRAEEKKQEEDRQARATAVREGRPQNQILDLSGIDDEIDFALDSILGPNLSYVPPPMPPADDDKDKK